MIDLVFAYAAVVLFWFFIAWCIFCSISGAVLSLGSPERMRFIDDQLSRDPKELQLKPQSMMSYEIITRFMWYCLTYPAIRHRSKAESWKFRFFMWFNFLGFWVFLVAIAVAVILSAIN